MACGNPEDVKVRRRDTKEVIPKTGGPQKYKSYDKTMGFQCYNKDQVDGQCLDYEISLCCPAGKLCFLFCFAFLCKVRFLFKDGKQTAGCTEFCTETGLRSLVSVQKFVHPAFV